MEVGDTNRNGQIVIAKTSLAGTDFGSHIDILACEQCGFIYGANTTDSFQRRCPEHQGGLPGHRYKKS